MELIYWVDNLIKRAKPYKMVLNNDQNFVGFKYNSASGTSKEFYDFVTYGLDERELFQKTVLENLLGGAALDDNVHNLVQTRFVEQDIEPTAIVGEINYSDLISLNNLKITDEMRQQYASIDQTTFPLLKEKSLAELEKPVYSYGVNKEIEHSWLKVDMSCSDSEIRAAFNEWLKLQRDREKSLIQQKRRVHKIKTINDTTLRKWHDARVLAYMDLMCWNFLNNQKVSSNVLGEILYPNPRLVSDRAKMIDDTTKPYAEKLTSDRFLRRVTKLVIDKKRKKIT